MSQKTQGAIGLATTMAIGVFLVAFACLWTLGDFGLFSAWFIAAVVSAIVWLFLYLALGTAPKAAQTKAPASAATTSQPAAAAPVAATAEAASTREPSEEAAEALQKVEAENAERAAAEDARRKTEEAEKAEAAEAKRKADAAAAAAENEADAAAAAASVETTPDYDGDGVKEGVNEGTRPAGLDAPRDGKADDLKQIKGVGAKMEELCNRLGFWHFDQIASWSADEVAWVDANLEGFKGRVTRDAWVEQAKLLASGGETEFSKRVEDGDVY